MARKRRLWRERRSLHKVKSKPLCQPEQAVAVQDAGTPLIKASEPEARLSMPPERPLPYRYDRVRSAAAWDQLSRPLRAEPENVPEYRLEVTMVGQFDTVPSPNPDHYGFGHLSACPHRLLLTDVLSAKLARSPAE